MTAPAVPESAERYAAVTGIDRWLTSIAFGAWGLLDPADLQASFVSSVLPALIPPLVQAQEAAAELGATIAANVSDAARRAVPAAFAGFAASGEPLTSSLVRPLVSLYQDLQAGNSWNLARVRSRDALEQVVVTEVHDAARQAEQVQMVATRSITYFVRVVEPGACSRCILLSGRRYRISRAFDRHPRCRCSMFPDAEVASQDAPSPKQIFDGLSRARQDDAFTKAGAQAIRDGADIGRVVNVRQGMSTATGKRKGKPARPQPEDIYRQAGGDRDVAINLLRRAGYIR